MITTTRLNCFLMFFSCAGIVRSIGQSGSMRAAFADHRP
jgi:hypothetical protein